MKENNLRYLRAVTTLPYVNQAGRVMERSSYDLTTGVLLHLPKEWKPNIPKHPTRDNVSGAVSALMRPWSGYKWSGPADAGAMISAVLAAVARPALSLCPAYIWDASTQGSGKTLAATAIGCLMTGQRVGVTAFAGSDRTADEEMKKRLLASAIDGQTFTCIDNVVGHWKSPTLAAYLTSGRVSDRVLGQSRTVNAEAVALVTATGNNCSLDADLSRRFVRVRIDSGSNPTQRRFDFTPTDAALSDRLKIAQAACVIWAAYFAADAPAVAGDDAGGYGEWVRMCRQPVLWLTSEGLCNGLGWGAIGDPAASLLVDPSTTDPEVEALGEWLTAMHALSDGQVFSSRQVVEWVRTGAAHPHANDPFALLFDAVRELLGPGKKPEDVSARSIGRMLMNRRDRVVCGLRLTAAPNGGDRQAWRISPVDF